MTGPPHVRDQGPILRNGGATNSDHMEADPLKVKQVIDFLPHLIDEAAVVKALVQTKGNINDAVSKLLDAHYSSSQSTTPTTTSSPGSVSIERESDTEDDEGFPPSKRQNRRVTADEPTQRENGVLDAGSDYEHAKAETNPLFEDHKKRVTPLDANDTSDATGTESDNEFCSPESNTSVSNSITTDDGKEVNGGKHNPPADVAKAKVKPADSDSEEEESEAIESASDNQAIEPDFDDEDIESASDDEADDEFRPDAEDD
jgi:hypothetical protein